MNTIRCTVCGSDDVEVRAFVKPNYGCECSTDDFSRYLNKIEDCFCCKCEENTQLKYFSSDMDVFRGDDLYELSIARLKESYVPSGYDDDTIYELAHNEYLRVKEEICLEYGFDDDVFINENGGESPFDEFDNAIREEVYDRIEGLNK